MNLFLLQLFLACAPDGDGCVVTDRVGDEVDQNCDGVDGVDRDGDGHPSVASGGGDCNDESAEIHPGAADVVGDGVDRNCDGHDGVDRDGDGHASEPSGGQDCLDHDANAYPGADDSDDCDGVDSDCAGPQEHLVKEGSEIQAAIDAATDGDIVCVEPGSYEETLRIEDKVIALKSRDGRDSTIVDANHQGIGLRLASGSSGSSVDGFTIRRGFTPDYWTGAAVEIDAQVEVELANLVLTESAGGNETEVLKTNDGSNVVLKDIRLIDNHMPGGWGPVVLRGERVFVENMVITGNSWSERGPSMVAEETIVRGLYYGHNVQTQSSTGSGTGNVTLLLRNADVAGVFAIGNHGDAKQNSDPIIDLAGSSASQLLVMGNSQGNHAACVRLTDSGQASHGTCVGNNLTDPVLDDSPGPAISTHSLDGMAVVDHVLVVAHSPCEAGVDEDIEVSYSWLDGCGDTDLGFVSFSPKVPPETWDLHLREDSPLRDAGDPNVLDPDGTVADLGAYGGPDADFSYYEDVDDDGLFDGWESLHALPAGQDAPGDDPDADGLTNEEEFEAGSLPMVADSDGDGAIDGDDSAPLDPESS